MEKTKGFEVSLGNGESITGFGECKGVRVQLDGVDVVEDFLPFNLGNSDVLFGVQWLEKLGAVTTNWKSQKMSFRVGRETVVLRGDPTLTHTHISLKAMIKTVRKTGGGLLLELKYIEGAKQGREEHSPKGVPLYLQPILGKYDAVFKNPTELPPFRGHEHSIVMKEGSNPVNIRPYRYPQIQKDEIERLVQEMLEAGVIQPSTSPYSSPVLLVKKKRWVVAFLCRLQGSK